MRLEFRLKGDDKIRIVEGSAEALMIFAIDEKIVVLIKNPRPSPTDIEAHAKQCRADYHSFNGTFVPLEQRVLTRA